MEPNSIDSRLKYTLQQGLPGPEFQYKLAPAGRQSIEDLLAKEPSPRPSAVMVLLYPGEKSLHTVLIQRPEYSGHHSGQVSFPGGREEEYDASPEATALREAFEETGISKEGLSFIGKLSPLFIPVSRYLIVPVIFFSSVKPELKPDPREVSEIILLNTAELFVPGNIKTTRIQLGSGAFVMAPYFDLHGKIIWGATAMILSELSEVLRRAGFFNSPHPNPSPKGNVP